jgi:hypothetical protein
MSKAGTSKRAGDDINKQQKKIRNIDVSRTSSSFYSSSSSSSS